MIGGETITWDYGYNALGMLTEVKKNNAVVESYTYDANGNRLSDNSRAYTYSNEDHVVTAGSDTYQFNVDGFLTAKTTTAGTATYSYSSRGELLSATLPNGTLITYEHDPFGRRIAKKVNGVVTEKYLWAGRITLLAVYDASNNLVMRFNYVSGRMPVSMTRNGVTYYLTYDQVGSLRAVVDTTGNVVKRVDYDSFGNISSDSNTGFNVPFGFAGGLHDRDTGLMRFGLRDYDPAIGRWTSKDPIDFAGGDTNLFNYVGASPINWTDIYGLSTATFDDSTDTLIVELGNGNVSIVIDVGNNTINPSGDPNTIGSNGPAPAGTFPVQPPVNTAGDPAYGPYFWPIGDVGPNGERQDIARQRGIGLHCGRTNDQSPTEGCIRMNNTDCELLFELSQDDPLTEITIRR